MAGPLAGIRIVDLSWGAAGPPATMTLSDQGAEVVKVEPPGGDPFRAYSGYTVWNRGKKSIVLDLRDPAGREALRALLETADVLVESFSPGVMDGWGLGYEDLRGDLPHLVYCSITGYGRRTRAASRPGIDALVQARSGQQFEQAGWREGPIFLRLPLPSLAASYLVASGVAAALYVREVTGRGQWVETSLYQGVLAFTTQLWQWAERMEGWFSIPKAPQPTIYECADARWVHSMHMAGGRGKDRSALWKVLDVEPVEGNPYDPVGAADLDRRMREAFRKHPRRHVLEGFWENGIPIQAIQTTAEALEDAQVIHNGAVVEVHDPALGRTRQVGPTFRLHAAPPAVQGPAPRVGQHGEEILGGLGSSRAAAPPRAPRPLRHALSGIRVLDFGSFLAGPFGPMILGDLGANVYKLESPEGDQMRSAGKPFNGCQRGKRDVSVNLKHPRGLEVAHRLMAAVDVIHHNMRPGVAERLGIDYATARRLNPRVVYCHTPAYGIEGPCATWPGFDQLFQAMCGLELEAGGEGNPPVWYRFGMCDTGNAFQSVIAVLLALYHRERTGEGQLVDTNLLNCGLYLNSDVFVGPDGQPNERPVLDARQMGLGPLYRLYETREGWLAIACLRDAHFEALCEGLGLPELRTDARFADAATLAARLEARFAEDTAPAWFARLDAAGVPCEVSDPEAGTAWLTDPDAIANGLVVEYRHPEYGRMRQFGHLVHFSETPGRIAGPPPLLGEHTRAVLREHGYAPSEMDELRAAGAVYWPG